MIRSSPSEAQKPDRRTSLTKPTVFNPLARVTSVANHTNTFHAPLLPRISSQVTTRVTIISAMTRSTTVVALIKFVPKYGKWNEHVRAGDPEEKRQDNQSDHHDFAPVILPILASSSLAH